MRTNKASFTHTIIGTTKKDTRDGNQREYALLVGNQMSAPIGYTAQNVRKEKLKSS